MRMKDVIISVTGVQQGVNGPDAMELVTAGQYGQDEKETLLTWQESELTGMEGGRIQLQELFRFERRGADSAADPGGGHFTGCDAVPGFYEELRRQGVALDLHPFDRSRS